jgi:urease gamma subunit
MAGKFDFHPSARVDRGGRNRNGQKLRREHLEAQAMIAKRVVDAVREGHDDEILAWVSPTFDEIAQIERQDAKTREMRSLMGAPSPAF